MGFVIDLGQVLEIQVGIDLRRTDIAVPEQFLHGSEVLAGFEQMAGEGMPEHMRMQVFGDAFFPAPLRQPQLNAALAQPRAAAGNK